jgi:hypothetical protein
MHFVVIFGPPAVGKMAVGRELERATGIRLFHNHVAIEPVLPLFEFGSPPFLRLVDGFRQRVFEEVAASDLPGLAFTFVWNFDSTADADFLQRMCAIFAARAATIAFVELRASLEARLERNRAPDRLLAKPSKRDVARSEARLIDAERLQLNSPGTIPLPYPHVVIDNTQLTATQVSDEIIAWLGLTRDPGR